MSQFLVRVLMLAQLGADCAADERIGRAGGYLVDHALARTGQCTASGAPSGTAGCLQGNLCWALVTLGYDLGSVAQRAATAAQYGRLLRDAQGRVASERV